MIKYLVSLFKEPKKQQQQTTTQKNNTYICIVPNLSSENSAPDIEVSIDSLSDQTAKKIAEAVLDLNSGNYYHDIVATLIDISAQNDQTFLFVKKIFQHMEDAYPTLVFNKTKIDNQPIISPSNFYANSTAK